ncbi:MAG: hypothetical protein M1542_08575 [Thermotogae bacterium]|jgi:hypothetical protein|nr:hypothetical protein [Thermotogota bacterium]
MINQSLILNKVIENVKNNYQLAVAQNDQTNMKKHQANMEALIQFQEQMRRNRELQENIIQMPHRPNMPKRGGK